MYFCRIFQEKTAYFVKQFLSFYRQTVSSKPVCMWTVNLRPEFFFMMWTKIRLIRKKVV